jgi:hypothetical protein
VERGGERPQQTGLASPEPGRAALDDERGGDHSGPGRYPGQARPGFLGGLVEMAGAARKRVEKQGAIAAVATGQYVGRIGRPEEDPAPPQIGAPGPFRHRVGMLGEPLLDQFLGELGGALAGRRGGEVAKPLEALQIVGKVGGQGRVVEIQAFGRDLDSAADEASVQDRLPGRLVPGHRILGNREQLERMAAAEAQGVERRSPGQAVDHRRQLLAERGAVTAADPDQPFARLDLAGVRRVDLLEQAHRRKSFMLAA